MVRCRFIHIIRYAEKAHHSPANYIVTELDDLGNEQPSSSSLDGKNFF